MRRFSFLVLLLCISGSVFAREETGVKTMAISFGPEWNMNSRENFAAAAVLAFDYSLTSSFAVGLNATVSSNFFGITVIEPVALFRMYFLGSNYAGWFAQADAGVYLVLEDSSFTTLFTGGLRSGLRLPFGNTFFVEPFGRIGYPFAFGFGVLGGVRFGTSSRRDAEAQRAQREEGGEE
jgi:hypothetical protein